MQTGIYLHVPFCRSRCTYCDFNTYVGMEDLYVAYATALESEIRQALPIGLIGDTPHQAATIFFGGGTPSLLSPQQLGQLITACRETTDLPDDAEITVECNPGTVTLDYLRELRAQGVNRLSFGAQSANPGELKLLGREHSWDQVATAIDAARAAGFDNLNFDLIFGLPYQSLASWQRTLAAAKALAPNHISLYALTIEQGTPMYDWTRRGEMPFPDPDVAADMYDAAEETLGALGYVHYEISNWCLPDRECAHNLIYWRNEPYYGLGAGAHSSSINRRWWKVRRPAEYIARAKRMVNGEPSTVLEMGSEMINPAVSRGETMMLGLRLLHEGIEQARFAQRYGAPITHFFADALTEAEAKGLIAINAQRICLTQRGRFLSNQVMKLFL
ncbi:MAG: radical SAM family heme chaperone HemW [Chloroflexota bacterium]